MTTWHQELELRVELVAGDSSLHRLLATLHRRRASIETITYSASSRIATIALSAPAQNADHIVSTLAREVMICHVEVVSSDRAPTSSPEGVRGPRSTEGDTAR